MVKPLITDTSYTTLLWIVLLASKDTKLKKYSLATAALFSGYIPLYSRSWKGHGAAYLKIGLDSFLNIFKGGILLQPCREVLHVIQQCIKCLTKLQRYMHGYMKFKVGNQKLDIFDHSSFFLVNFNNRIIERVVYVYKIVRQSDNYFAI